MYEGSPDEIAQKGRNPIGSGPFKFESWEQNTKLNVVKNGEYWRDGLPHLDAVEFSIVNELFAEAFPVDPPARMTMQVPLPHGLLISVGCVAVAG